MAKRKNRKKKSTNKFFFKIPFLLVILTVLTLISLSFIGSSKHRNPILTYEDENIEQRQNTVPKDVIAMVKGEKKVLGVNTAKNTVPQKSVHVPILMYHYVEYVKDRGDRIRISLDTTPYTLEEEIKTLVGGGYTFITASELAEAIDGKRQLPTKPIVLTFDDGYRDFYTDAYPILKKYHAKATQYVISGFLDVNRNHMLSSQVAEIASEGLVEIGAHTVNHVWLKGQSQEILKYEAAQSKKTLEEAIRRPIVSFAYPYGAFDAQTITAVKKVGYTSATSTIPGIDQSQSNEFFLYRLRPGGRTGEGLLSWLSSVTNPAN